MRIATEELIQELNRLDRESEGSPTMREMDQEGEYSHRPYVDRFGSWSEALTEAGLERNTDITQETLIEELRQLAEELDRSPSQADMNDHGPRSHKTYTQKFGSWNAAKEAANLEKYPPHGVSGKKSKSYAQIEVDCTECGDTFERQPAKIDKTDNNFCSRGCYAQWLQADVSDPDLRRDSIECEVCGCKKDVTTYELKHIEHHFCSKSCYGEWQSENLNGEDNPNYKGGVRTYYGGSWKKQRQKALDRDNQTCQSCGSEQDLHVHHIIPFNEFEESEEANELGNLVTLCSQCHRRWEGIPVRPNLIEMQ